MARHEQPEFDYVVPTDESDAKTARAIAYEVDEGDGPIQMRARELGRRFLRGHLDLVSKREIEEKLHEAGLVCEPSLRSVAVLRGSQRRTIRRCRQHGEGTGAGGQPTKLTPQVQETIVRAIALGNYTHIAAEAAGISERSFYTWMERGQADIEANRRSEYSQFSQAVKGQKPRPRWRPSLTCGRRCP